MTATGHKWKSINQTFFIAIQIIFADNVLWPLPPPFSSSRMFLKIAEIDRGGLMQIYLALCVSLRRTGYLGERNTEMNQSPSGEQGDTESQTTSAPCPAPGYYFLSPFSCPLFLAVRAKVQNLISMRCGSKINPQCILKPGWNGGSYSKFKDRHLKRGVEGICPNTLEGLFESSSFFFFFIVWLLIIFCWGIIES